MPIFNFSVSVLSSPTVVNNYFDILIDSTNKLVSTSVTCDLSPLIEAASRGLVSLYQCNSRLDISSP